MFSCCINHILTVSLLHIWNHHIHTTKKFSRCVIKVMLLRTIHSVRRQFVQRWMDGRYKNFFAGFCIAYFWMFGARVYLKVEKLKPLAEHFPVLCVFSGHVAIRVIHVQSFVNVLSLVRMDWVGAINNIKVNGSIWKTTVGPICGIIAGSSTCVSCKR